jgi:hypothetical protein
MAFGKPELKTVYCDRRLSLTASVRRLKKDRLPCGPELSTSGAALRQRQTREMSLVDVFAASISDETTNMLNAGHVKDAN